MDYLERWAKEFTNRRAAAEGFPSLRAGILDAKLEFLKLLFVGYCNEEYFYMRSGKVIEQSKILHKQIHEEDPNFHNEMIRYAREKASIKDQVLIGAYYSKDIETLLTFPPRQVNKLLKWFGIDAKMIVQQYLNALTEDKWQLYAITNKNILRTFAFKYHLKIPSKIFDFIMHPTKYNGDIEIFKAYKDYVLNHELRMPLPFQTLITIKPPTLDQVHNLQISPYTALSFAKTMAILYGEEFVIKHLRDAKYITVDKWVRPVLLNALTIFPKLEEYFAVQYTNNVKEAYKDIILPFEQKKLKLIIDVSGSMSGRIIQDVAIMIAPLAGLAEQVIFFNNDAWEEESGILHTIEGLRRLIKMPEGGTNISAGLKAVKREENEVIVLITDEQENRVHDPIEESNVIPDIVINPLPYATHLDYKKPYMYIPARTPDSFVAAYKLQQLHEAQTKGIDIMTLIKSF